MENLLFLRMKEGLPPFSARSRPDLPRYIGKIMCGRLGKKRKESSKESVVRHNCRDSGEGFPKVPKGFQRFRGF